MIESRLSTLVLILSASFLAGTNGQDCDPLMGDDLGSSSQLSTDGLVAEAFTTGGENKQPPMIQILNYTVVCEVAGSRLNTARGVSVLVHYDCESTREDIEDQCSPDSGEIVAQFQFSCSDSGWTVSVGGTPAFVVSATTEATLDTELDNMCSVCVDPVQVPSADPVTHCIECHPSCNQGQMRCIGPNSNECCNFYQDDECVDQCNDGLVPDDSFQCVCPGLSSPANGMISSSDATMIGETVSYSCINQNFILNGPQTRTCTPDGWDGTDPTCSELVECYTDMNCFDETETLLMTRRQCCVDTQDSVGFKLEGQETCNICVVFGFNVTTFTASEQGQGYAVSVGYIKRPRTDVVALTFTVTQEFVTANMTDFNLQTTQVAVLPNQPEPRSVTFTFLVDAIAQERNETVTLRLIAADSVNNRFGSEYDNTAFFLDTVELTILDSDTVDISLTEEDYRSSEPDLLMNVRVTKNTRIATPVTVRVTPVNISQHSTTGRDFPSALAEDNPVLLRLSPIEADENDFDNSVIVVTFQPDETGDQMNDINTPVAIMNDTINEAKEQNFVVTLDIVSAIDESSITTIRKDAVCRIIDDDDIAIGFEEPSYMFTEPETERNVLDEVYLAKEGGVISEQTFQIVVTVSGGTPDQTISAAERSMDGNDNDYTIGARNFVELEIDPDEQRIAFPFRLFGDNITEGTEAFQASPAARENAPNFLQPTVLSANTFIIIEDDDIVIIGFERGLYSVNESVGMQEICAVVTFPSPNVTILTDIVLSVNTTEGTANEMDYVRIAESDLTVFLPFDDVNRRACFNLQINDDGLVEDTESLTIDLVFSSFFPAPSGVRLDPNVTTVEIMDDDAFIVVGWESPEYNVDEDSGQVELCAVVTVPAPGVPILTEIFLSVNTMEGTANEMDYGRIAESDGAVFLQFGNENRRACFDLEIINDGQIEDTESLTIDLVFSSFFPAPSSVILDPDVTTVEIVDDDALIVVGWESPEYNVDEDSGQVELCAVITKPPAEEMLNFEELFLSVTTRDISAVEDFDYMPIFEEDMFGPFGDMNRRNCLLVNITDDAIPELTETFNALLEVVPNPDMNPASELVSVRPNTTTINIVDNDVPIVVGWESPEYNVDEDSGQVELCAVITSPPADVELQIDDFNLAVSTQDVTAVADMDYDSLSGQTIGPFGNGSRRSCVSVDIIDDAFFEDIETFIGVLEVIPGVSPPPELVTISPSTTAINIEDDGPTLPPSPPVNDTIVGDPLLTAPLLVRDRAGIPNVGPGDPINLCYEVRARPNAVFNLVSDMCVTVNAHYTQVRPNERLNIIDAIYVRAVDSEGNCHNIAVNLDQCMPSVNLTEVQMLNINGVNVRKIRNRVRIAVPNCRDLDLVMWVFCQNRTVYSTVNADESFKVEMIRFVISRGFSLQESSHGILGQFWNVPVDVERFNGSLRDGSDPGSNAYALTVNYPGQSPRVFVGWLYRITWEKRDEYCLYAGNGQGGKTYEVPDPFNDPVLEGKYTDYMIGSPFETSFMFNHFDEGRCN